ncbi:MAG: DNA replication and repair protein RecF [Prevotella sp.]|nr:DNA replication and repair protein RecF [Prevotella sp.]
MILEKLSLINYKNITEATLELSPKINCFIGQNGVGKTNVLDAIYYLSFCHSANNPIDSQVIRHGEEFFMIEGLYRSEKLEVRGERIPQGSENNLQQDISLTTHPSPLTSNLSVSCGMKRGQKKHFKRNKKEYKRLSEHIGLIPIVVVSPSDTLLIEGGSEERRRLMDMVISQYDSTYIEALNRYNKALQQRNTMLKAEEEPDIDVISIWEEQMASAGEHIYKCRDAFVKEMVPIFQRYYETISGNQEKVALNYISHCQRGPLLEVIQRDSFKDRAVGYSLHGVHRDDLEFMLGDHLMKREGSQGQNKTFVISLKLAQFDFLKRTNSKTTPLLLLDDIFDKLDAGRVEQIVNLVAGDEFGQIFITDTNRDHLDQILSASSHDYRIFHVDNGDINRKSQNV